MSDFASHLIADGPEPSLAGELDLFGRLTGTWRVRNRYRSGPAEPWAETERRWIFSWIAAGRGIQDVIVGGDRSGDEAVAGTTVRAYDPAIDAWRVNWFGTQHGFFCALIARPHGADGIRQDGVEFTRGGDIPIRWNFSDITPDSFTWNGWSSPDGGATWWLEQHMDAVRDADG
ncbi:hypothetical protein [Microbacterium ulmi]|uniref:DUF1579 domain-containing protein n=1 Tax=Microbacterium ulmi TaxID=179095 RepID=A0A7Y2LZP8_9MICO|nr:hypothetical protein [Microbacterium ulmi]NII69172.1 hypothetical protein [Microbacterium ulmi]NNH03712.1 hypothetical protein [Microbacterium ulmi]